MIERKVTWSTRQQPCPWSAYVHGHWQLPLPSHLPSVVWHGPAILARGGEPLEDIRDAKTLGFDKTCTVTLAEPQVSEVIPINTQERELLTIAASVESRFNHPIASSVLNYTRAQGITDLKNVGQTEDLPGRGINATVEGREVIIGSLETLENIGITLPEVEYQGRAIWVAVDQELKGIIIIRDVMHSQMRGLADSIRSCGIEKVILATGDNEEKEAKRVAEIVGADEYHFNCKLADKVALIKELQSNGKVIMVGDGVNDAPSLAAANVGIAIGGHKNVNLTIRSVDIVILGEDVRGVLGIFRSSRKLRRVLDQDYAWAFSFNIVGLSLATLGILTPIPAAILHHVSSVFVVANASRIYFERHTPK